MFLMDSVVFRWLKERQNVMDTEEPLKLGSLTMMVGSVFFDNGNVSDNQHLYIYFHVFSCGPRFSRMDNCYNLVYSTLLFNSDDYWIH